MMSYISIPIIWLLLLIIFALVEFFTQGITTIWFALAAGISLLLSLIGTPISVQIIVFIIVSLFLLLFIRQILVKKYNKSLAKTNVEAVVGEEAIVVEAVNNISGAGRVNIKGMEWAAAAEDASASFEIGAKVTVVDVKGVKVIVK